MFDALKYIFSSKKSDQNKSTNQSKKIHKKYALNCGRVERDDKQIEAGWAITKGRRSQNEDNIYCKVHPIPGGQEEDSSNQVTCLAIFDGHGGAKASDYVRDHLFENLLNHPSFQTDIFKAFEDAFVKTDADYIKQDEVQRNDDGCTATAAVIVGRRLVIAHVGDSRAVICHAGAATPLTKDHKPNRPDERKRIEDVGGTVIHAGTWRVGGVLAVSRSFGNRMMKQFIVPLPEIREDVLNEDSQCVVLASDGVWDVVANDEATTLVMKHGDAESAATALAVLAYDRGSCDNISCVVCKLKFTGDTITIARSMHAIPEDGDGEGDMDAAPIAMYNSKSTVSSVNALGGSSVGTISSIDSAGTISTRYSSAGVDGLMGSMGARRMMKGTSSKKSPLVTADTAKSMKIVHNTDDII